MSTYRFKAQGADGPAGTAGTTAIGSMLLVGYHAPPSFDNDHAAALELSADAWMVTAVAPCAPILRAVLNSAAAASSPEPCPARTTRRATKAGPSPARAAPCAGRAGQGSGLWASP